MQQQTLLLGSSSGGDSGGRTLHDHDVNMDDSMDDAMEGGDAVAVDALHGSGGHVLE